MFWKRAMKVWCNYLGQLRIYSLVDLMLMLVVAGASMVSFRYWGAVILWVGFLAYLESQHHDTGRELVSELLAWTLLLWGLMWWSDSTTGYLFVVCSICYAQKKHRPWGLISPFLRGAQALLLVGAITGFNHSFPWVAATATIIRNLLGDLRDAQEDAGVGQEAEVLTWSVVFGCRSRPFVHLFGVYGTTIIWWLFAVGLPGWLLPMILIIETATYWLTPRPSNKNAAAWLHNKILRLRRWGGR